MARYYEVLKRERKRMGRTQAEMAELLGLSRSAYSLYESGKRAPKIETFQKITDALNISMDELIGYEYQRKVTIDNGGIDIDSDNVRKELKAIQANKLQDSINKLNEEGQQKVKDYADDLAENPKYRKVDTPEE